MPVEHSAQCASSEKSRIIPFSFVVKNVHVTFTRCFFRLQVLTVKVHYHFRTVPVRHRCRQDECKIWINPWILVTNFCDRLKEADSIHTVLVFGSPICAFFQCSVELHQAQGISFTITAPPVTHHTVSPHSFVSNTAASTHPTDSPNPTSAYRKNHNVHHLFDDLFTIINCQVDYFVSSLELRASYFFKDHSLNPPNIQMKLKFKHHVCHSSVEVSPPVF